MPYQAKKVMSNRVKQLGVDLCELCKEPGTLDNPLTAHHSDGDKCNNDPSNFLVVHNWLCHRWADWFTQWFMSHNLVCTPADIKWAYALVSTSNWLITLTKNRRQ